MYVLNIFIILIVLSIIYVLYLKIRYPFWSNQPVLHNYDFIYNLVKKPFILMPNKIFKNKYCNFNRTKTLLYTECSQTDKENLENLIQCYYLSNETILHIITKEDIDTYLKGGKHLSFVSFYMDEILPMYVACITSSYINVFVWNNKEYLEYPFYFIDFISINREQNTVKVCRELIQTHVYNQRIENPNIKCSLIRKEIKLFETVIPIVEFKTSTYNLRNNRFPPLPSHFVIQRINNENIDILQNFIDTQTKTKPHIFDICVFRDITTIIEMIKKNLYYIYCLKKRDDIYGFYFIKDTKTNYEIFTDEKENNTVLSLHCVSSFSNTMNERLFYLGFLHSIHSTIKYNKNYKILIIDEINHNIILTNHWRKKYTPLHTNISAYYFINLIYRKVEPTKVCILV